MSHTPPATVSTPPFTAFRRRRARTAGADLFSAVIWTWFAMALSAGAFLVFGLIDLSLAKMHSINVMSRFSIEMNMKNAFDTRVTCAAQSVMVESGTGSLVDDRLLPRGYYVDHSGTSQWQTRETLRLPYGGVAEYSVRAIASDDQISSGAYCEEHVQTASLSGSDPYGITLTSLITREAKIILVAKPHDFIPPSTYGKTIVKKENNGGNGNSNGIGNGDVYDGTAPGNSAGNAHCAQDPNHSHLPGGVDEGIGNDFCGPGVLPPVEVVEVTNPDPSSGTPTSPEEPQTDSPEAGGDDDVDLPALPVEPTIDIPTGDTDAEVPGTGTDPDPAQGTEQTGENPAPPSVITPDTSAPDETEEPELALPEIPAANMAHTVTVYWKDKSRRARALCRFMSEAHGPEVLTHGPMGNDYRILGRSCEADIPEFTVAYN